MGSVGVSSHLPLGFAGAQQSNRVAGGSNHIDNNFPFASPLQAKFVCRARLVELDGEEKIKRRRRWDAVKTWTWGYDTQRRLDAAQGEEATGDDGKQACAVEEAADAENSSEGRVAKHRSTTAEVKVSGSVGSSAAGGRPILADVATPAQSEGRRSPRKSPGSAPGERSPQSVEGAVAVAVAVASEDRRGDSRGFSKTKVAPSGIVISAHGVSPSPGGIAVVASSETLESKKHLQLRSAASLPGVPGVSSVGESAGRDVDMATIVLTTTAEKDEESEDVESVDWLRHVWSQCRIQAVKTYSLLLPMPLPALALGSVHDGRGKDKYDGDDDGVGGGDGVGNGDEDCEGDGGIGGALDDERLSRSHPPSGSVNFVSAWGGNYFGEEGVGRGGIGVWDAFNPLVRRQFGSGAAGSTAGDFNLAYSSPNVCQPLSSAYNNNGGAGPFRNRRGTPDLGGHSASASAGFSVSGVGFLHRDRKQASSETDDLEGSRSRSASSGLGRESFDGSLAGGDEKFDRTALIARSLPYGDAPALAAGMVARGSASRFDSGRTVHGEDVGRGDSVQARSMSLAEAERDEPRSFDPRACAPLRRQSARSGSMQAGDTAAATVAAAAKHVAGVRTPECHELDETSGALENEAVERTLAHAVTLAWRFVNAYSAYLAENLDFKLISRGNEVAVNSGSECDPWVIPILPSEAEATAMPLSRSNVNAIRGCDTSADGVEGGSSGRGSRKVKRSGSGESRSGADVICARRLLRLGMDLSNTIALVEITVTVEREKIKAAAAAAAAAAPSRNQDMPTSEGSPAFEGQPEQGYPRIAAEKMLASLKLWTLDVEEPKEGWGAEGPPGGVCEDSIEGREFSWWAKLPTLDSFRWCMDPDDFVRGRCLPDELPIELRRLIVALRFQKSLDDFLLGQVDYLSTLFFHRDKRQLGNAWASTVIRLFGLPPRFVPPHTVYTYACLSFELPGKVFKHGWWYLR